MLCSNSWTTCMMYLFGYYLLNAFLLCNLLVVLALLWLAKVLVWSTVGVILRQLKFSRVPGIEKFLNCPIAHRCGTPENSLAGIRWCKQHGAVTVEMDLNFTKDNVPTLFHDNVNHLTFEEVKMTKGTISTLHEALELCKELNLRVILDIKTWLRVIKVANMIGKLYTEDESLYDRMLICSFSPLLIMAVRIIDRKIPVAITHRSYALTSYLEGRPVHKIFEFVVPYLDRLILWSIHTWFIELFGISLMLVHKDDLSKYYVESWKRKNVKILAWTVNNKHEQVFCEEVLKIPYMTDELDS